MLTRGYGNHQVLVCRFALASNGDESIPPEQCGVYQRDKSILLYPTQLVTRFFPALFSGSGGEEKYLFRLNALNVTGVTREAKITGKTITPSKTNLTAKSGTSILLYQTQLVTRFYPALFTQGSGQEMQVLSQDTKIRTTAKSPAKISHKSNILAKTSRPSKRGLCGKTSLFQTKMSLLAKILCGLLKRYH